MATAELRLDGMRDPAAACSLDEEEEEEEEEENCFPSAAARLVCQIICVLQVLPAVLLKKKKKRTHAPAPWAVGWVVGCTQPLGAAASTPLTAVLLN